VGPDRPTAADRERFRRIVQYVIGLLALGEALAAVSTIYLGLTWLVVTLLVGTPICAAYLTYLVRHFAKLS